MISATYPELFSTVNFTSFNNLWVVKGGFLFICLVLLGYFLNKKHKQPLKVFGVSYYWLAALVVWFGLFGLGDALAWSKDLLDNKILLNKSVAERQGERLCQITYNVYEAFHCPYLALYNFLEQIKPGSKLYLPESFVTTKFYLHYFLAGKYEVVSDPVEADYLILISPVYPHDYQGGVLFEYKDENWQPLGRFILVGSGGGASLFIKEKK